MIPILYDKNETAFTSNGIGRLSDCLSCLVTEERNGGYEVEFTYPITGQYYNEIREGRIISVTHDEQKDRQPFQIYRSSKPINGVCTFWAHHISYELSKIICTPFTAQSVADAFNYLVQNALVDNTYTFWTDNTTGGTLTQSVPESVRAILGGHEGSILDIFGGEYEFDKKTVKLYAHRGQDNNVYIRYGKNLADINQTYDEGSIYNSVVPYWTDRENTVVYGNIITAAGIDTWSGNWTDEHGTVIQDENSDNITFSAFETAVSVLDLTEKFDSQPTVAELQAEALAWLERNQPWVPKENIKVDFVALWQTEEYKNIAPLERVRLCDTVNVIYPELGVQATAKVIKVVWDALLDRYDTIELGQAKSSFASTILSDTSELIENIVETLPSKNYMQEAIDHATELITGGLGGHIVFLYDANGKPTDMLVMDTEDVNTAVHVLRINVNGIGFSSNGVSGTYRSAWTLDGAFVADFITSGHISCDRIQGGMLTLGGKNNGNGVLVVYNASGTEIGRWDNTGITASGNFIMFYSNGGTQYTGQMGSFNYYDVGLNSITSKTGYGFSVQTPSTQHSIDINRNGQEYVYNSNGSWSKTIFKGNSTSYSAYVVSLGGINSRLELYSNESAVTAGNRLGVYIGSSSTTNRTYVYMPHGQLNITDTEIILSRDYTGSQTNDLASNKPYMRLGSASIALHSTNSNVWMGVSSSAANIYVSSSVYLRYVSSYWKIGTSYSSQTGNIAIQGSSARRYKHDITDQICGELDAHRLYNLTMKQFVFNDDCEKWQYPGMKGKTLPGFIAEDVEEIYPAAAIYDVDGQIESWDERRIIPGMLKLIQEQHDEIEELKERLSKLEHVVETLMGATK